MDAFHPGAVSPHTGVPATQNLEVKHFVYDLELDEQKNIIGGEWHSDKHPDFIWFFPEKYNPLADPAYVLSLEASLLGPLADSSTGAEAIKNSKRGRLMAEIVYKLLYRSIR